MFADLLFITLLIIGLLAAIPATVLIIYGIIIKARTTFIIGLLISIVPVLCFGHFFWFYYVYIPDTKDKNLIEFSGLYRVDLTNSYNTDKEKFSDTNFYMTLKADMTFKLDSTPDMNFYGTGIWDNEGTDGQYRFFDGSGKLLNWASPFGGHEGRQLIFNLYDTCEVKFVQIKN